jgi:hypothetical protein
MHELKQLSGIIKTPFFTYHVISIITDESFTLNVAVVNDVIYCFEIITSQTFDVRTFLNPMSLA